MEKTDLASAYRHLKSRTPKRGTAQRRPLKILSVNKQTPSRRF
ncbi:hypothetical protein ACLJJ6_10895 (plasmid) [Pediococcus siamensis]